MFLPLGNKSLSSLNSSFRQGKSHLQTSFCPVHCFRSQRWFLKTGCCVSRVCRWLVASDIRCDLFRVCSAAGIFPRLFSEHLNERLWLSHWFFWLFFQHLQLFTCFNKVNFAAVCAALLAAFTASLLTFTFIFHTIELLCCLIFFFFNNALLVDADEQQFKSWTALVGLVKSFRQIFSD